jgi:RimJ/RimL family protein N-acetyltransferase
MKTLTDIYPLYALHVSAGPLELRVVRDDDIPALVALAEQGIHDPAVMPFSFPWTDAPSDELPMAMARHYWGARARQTKDAWSLECVVRRNGEVVGIQAIETSDFLITRSGETGSWLARRHHGQGIGTAMRQVICAVAFDYLDFEEITSGAFADNPASRAVSRKVGYRENGRSRTKRRDGELASLERLVLTPSDLIRSELEIRVEGLSDVRRFLGLDA